VFIDAHNHLLMSYAGWDGQEPRALPLGEILSRLREGNVGAVGLIVGGRRAFPQRDPTSSWRGTLDALAQFWRGQAAAANEFRVIRSAADIDRISADAPGLLLGIEGASLCFDSPLEDSIAALHLLVRLGVRSVQLLAALPNLVFDTGADSASPPRLSRSGRALIAEANRLGLVIDVAHLAGDKPAFEEILNASSTPPIASHHSCRALNDSSRALDDDAIRLLADAGGVVGIHSGSAYLTQSGGQATLSAFIGQIRHVVDLVGIDHVAIGTDYIDASQIPIDLPASTFMEGMDGPESFGRIDGALAEAGFDEVERRKVLCENVLRIWRTGLESRSCAESTAA